MYKSQRNYENLEKRLFNAPGKYGIPEIERTYLKNKKIEFIPFNMQIQQFLQSLKVFIFF